MCILTSFQELKISDEQGQWITQKEISPLFVPRSRTSHKGTHGHLLLMGGSSTKPGAILLAGRAALRAGAGLVTVALPDKAFDKLSKGFLELMYEPQASNKEGAFGRLSDKGVMHLLQDKSALGIGPGMGTHSDTKLILSRILKNFQKPMVLDADALNVLSSDRKRLQQLSKLRKTMIMTPHPGEMARLVGTTVSKIQANREKSARDFATRHRVFVVLKGNRTVISDPEGRLFINSTGNPGMATAGMGDVLTGILASFLVQGFSPLHATLAAVYIHGRAGDRVAERIGDRGLLAGDVIDEIPLAIRETMVT